MFMHTAAVEVQAPEAALVALEVAVLAADSADDLRSPRAWNDAAGCDEALGARLQCEEEVRRFAAHSALPPIP
jgi:hypothetical protein